MYPSSFSTESVCVLCGAVQSMCTLWNPVCVCWYVFMYLRIISGTDLMGGHLFVQSWAGKGEGGIVGCPAR